MTIEKITALLKKNRQSAEFISPDVLEPIPYEYPTPNTWIEIENPEFSSLCPKTGLPDYGTVQIRYLPRKKIVELKSLKYYFLQFRNTGIFYEHLTRLIMDHLIQILDPLEIQVTATFTPRGGITSKVTSKHTRKN